MELKISKDIVLPTRAVTSKLAFIGQSGSGKTYGAGKFTEECLEIGAQVIVVDNVGIWWGLRLAANGTSPGISIPVFGGEHQDVPLEPESGAFIARLIAEKKFSCILDVSDFTEGEKHRWTDAFAKEFLFQKKRHKSAVNIVWEECHEFVPEVSFSQTAAMLGSMQRLIKKGRNYGIGTTLISQQPQSVSKSVLNQTEILFAFKANGKHERKAIKDWVVYNHVENAVQEAVDILPELEPGECFIWSPTMLKVFERIKIGKKKTFDASATPEFDEGEVKTGKLAKIDLNQISEEMQGLIEKAKEEDPAYLRQQIAGLKKELEMARKQTKTEEVQVLSEKDFTRLEKLVQPLSACLHDLEQRLEKVNPAKLVQNDPIPRSEEVILLPRSTFFKEAPRPSPPIPRSARPAGDVKKLVGKEVEMLRILAIYPEGLTRTELAVRAVITQSGTFATYLSDLRTLNYVDDIQGGRLVISSEGKKVFRQYFPNGAGSRPTPVELVERWKQKYLTGKACRMIDIILEYGGRFISREKLAQETPIEMSGTYATYLSNINACGLVDKTLDGLRASRALLEA